MKNKEMAFLDSKAISAKGRPQIDIWDIDTHRILNRVEGKNHVFDCALKATNWSGCISKSMLCLTDSTREIDTQIPYVMGKVVGCGFPSQDGAGLYQGAYNAANQVLSTRTDNTVTWKFQYDFTSAQCNATIGTLGLTNQFGSAKSTHFSAYSSTYASNSQYFCDGRYQYTGVKTGVILKSDIYTGHEASIDLSSILGTSSSGYLYVGYEPETGYYHVYKFYNTPQWFVFSDNTFSSLLATYNVTFGDIAGYSFFVHNGQAYCLTSDHYQVLDYINNNSAGNFTLNAADLSATSYGNNYGYSSCIFVKGTNIATSTGLLNASTLKYDAFFNNGGFNSICPLESERLLYNLHDCTYNCAVSAYKLPEPVTKTSSNGMTVTYELEVTYQ